jgi:hypothetical protein
MWYLIGIAGSIWHIRREGKCSVTDAIGYTVLSLLGPFMIVIVIVEIFEQNKDLRTTMLWQRKEKQ